MSIWTKDKVREFVRENNIIDGKSLESAFIGHYKGLIQAIMEEEMDNELGYSKYDWKNKQTDNSRNGHTKKTVRSHFGQMTLSIPRDTDREFEPVIVKKHERSLSSKIEDMIISMYAKGMSTRDIDSHVKSIYGIDISAEMVSRITDKIIPLAKEWQNRALEPLYPMLYLDGMVFSVAQDGQIVKKTVYIVYGLTIEGKKDILGIWIGEAESSKFWMKVLVDIKNRGVKDILLAAVDGLNGFVEAIASVFPKTEVQQCIVHQVRTSTKFVGYKDLKPFCADLKLIYKAPNEEAALAALDQFEDKWGSKYSYAIRSWRDKWSNLSPFFKYSEEIRRMMYTTNAIEGLNRRIRKITKTKGAFPTDVSLIKLLYLIVMDVTEKWTMPIDNWGQILQQLSIYFGERLEVHMKN